MVKRVCAFVILVLLVLDLAACREGHNIPLPPPLNMETERQLILEESDTTIATVYYATLDMQYLLPLNLEINATKEVAKVAMEKLLAGPPTTYAAPLLPADTKLLDLYSSQNTIYVNVTDEITKLTYKQAPLAIESILYTILPLAEGYTLQILIEGQVGGYLGGVDISAPLSQPMPGINTDKRSQELWRLHKEDMPLMAGKPLTYYLSDPQAMYLVPQTLYYLPSQAMALSNEAAQDLLNNPQTLALAALKAMLEADEKDSGLWSPFWPSTKILDIWIENNIAYVDFSAHLTGYGGGAAAENMMLSCLIYTLTAIPGISAIQVLIEGRTGTLPEGLDISKPLTPQAPLNLI